MSGPAGEVARFRAAARGTGGIPWHLDLDHEEARLLAPMAGQGRVARALARELREVIAARHDQVLARWHEPGGCPLDLHRLIPIPDAILALGEDAPAARHWLWAHWGTTYPSAPGAASAGKRRSPAAALGPRGLRIPVGRLDAVAGHRPVAAATGRHSFLRSIPATARPTGPAMPDDGAGRGRSAFGRPLHTATRCGTTGTHRHACPSAPMLHLDGFDGPIDLLLDLAERQRLDLGRLSLIDLVEQFVAASAQLASACADRASR